MGIGMLSTTSFCELRKSSATKQSSQARHGANQSGKTLREEVSVSLRHAWQHFLKTSRCLWSGFCLSASALMLLQKELDAISAWSFCVLAMVRLTSLIRPYKVTGYPLWVEAWCGLSMDANSIWSCASAVSVAFLL